MVRRFRKKSNPFIFKTLVSAAKIAKNQLKKIKRRKPLSFRFPKHLKPWLIWGTSSLIVLSVAWLLVTIKTLPDPNQFSSRAVSQSTKIWDKTGTMLLYDIHGLEKRTVISFADIPETVKQTTLAAEDAGFYEHPAFDIKAMFRGIIINPLFRGTPVQGGSTITQQLVKNTLLTSERRLSRKIKELFLAVRFEKKYTKDQILEFYLNQIPYGSNVYGIEAASQTFLNKSARDLSLGEAAILAALIKRPSYLSPYGTHTQELKARQEYILNRLASLGWITDEQAQTATKQTINFSKQRAVIKAPHFVMHVKSLLEDMFDEQYLETGGLQIITSLDWPMQQIAEQAVTDGAKRNDVNWHADNAALVAQDPKTGQILAMVGSRDYFDESKDGNVNVSLQVRQPGSSFKPFVYLKAFQKGYSPDTVLFDVFTEFNTNCNVDGTPRIEVNPDDCYHPQNYDGQYRGPVSLRQSLQQSLNLPSAKLLYLVGIQDAIELAQSFGISTLTEPATHYGLSLILGGGGVKLIDMVKAYSVFAQEGIIHPQTAILSIKDNQGKTIWETKTEEKRVFEAGLVRILNNVLTDDQSRVPAFSPNGPLTVAGYQVAAKTGTSQDYRDAWTIGFSPGLVAGVWVGNNDYSPMQKGGAGGMAAAPIWNDFMKQVLPLMEKQSFATAEIPIPEKPVLKGDYLVATATGPQIHSILYWVDKNNPQGPAPQNPDQDPQFPYWEYGVSQWVNSRLGSFPFSPGTIPSNKPSIILQEPRENSVIRKNSALQITFSVQSPAPIQKALLLFNQTQVYTFAGAPENIYSIFFVPNNIQAQNTITIQVTDETGHQFQIAKEFQGE
jgi:penicillin-binding protein 1C